MSDKYAVLASYAQHMVDTGRDVAPFTSQEIIDVLAERDADRARIGELTEALKHSVAGYKSCLRMGYDRIIDLGGDCDAPEVMIAGNPDIQQAENLLSAGISLKIEGE